MSGLKSLTRTDEWPPWAIDALAVFVLALGFGIRLWGATSSFVNPDEAYHALLSSPESFGDAYRSAMRSPHPPLFILVLHYIRMFTTSDLGIRIVPVIAGTLFPWVVYRWVGRGWNKLAGLGALAMLALTPELIKVSWEARGYTPALLFMAGALYLLDRAIEESSPWKMVGFALCLYGAIFSDYSALFFMVAAGIYFLLRIRDESVTTGVRILWELSQVGAVVVYAVLWVTQISPLKAIVPNEGHVTGWLADSYLQPGQNVVVFAVLNTARQFAYLLPLLVPAVIAILLFFYGLWLLWTKSSPGKIWHSRATAALFLFPFVAACFGACIHLFPYGRTRHTIFLALFIASGVSIAAARLARRWIIPAVIVCTILTPMWHWFEGRHKWETGRIERQRHYMMEAIDFLKKSAPPGTLMLTSGEVRVVLAYYMDRGVRLPEIEGTPSEEEVGGFRMFAGRWSFSSMDDVRNDLRLMRGQYGLGPEVRIWLLDGGFQLLLEPELLALQKSGELPDVFVFGFAMAAALTPEGFLWEPPGPADRVVVEKQGMQPAIPEY